MKTILVTGFEPFPGTPINPTALLVDRLPRRLPAQRNVRFVFHRLPTTWSARLDTTAVLRRDLQPDAIVHLGVDGTRRNINVETRAVNRQTRIRPDAKGEHARHAPIDPAGPLARFSSLPVRALRDAAARSGAPVALSRNAGDYLCNATLWDSIASGIPSVFIHVPSIQRGPYDRHMPFLKIEEAVLQILREVARRI